MKLSTTHALRASAAIMLGWCVGCDGPGTDLFVAQPVSRSMDSGPVEFGSVEADSDIGRAAPPVAPSLRRVEPRDRQQARCAAELRSQSSYPFDFRVRSLRGRNLSKRQFAGRLLVVDIWATWCGPCIREVPLFIDLQHRYRDQGLSMVGINFERGASDQEDRRRVETFAREVGINYPLALGTPWHWAIRGSPTRSRSSAVSRRRCSSTAAATCG